MQIEEQDWYHKLVDECKEIINQTEYTARWALVAGYHKLGERLLQEHQRFERSHIYGQEITTRVSQSLERSPRTIERAIKFAKKYPDLTKLPGGTDVSWRDVCNKLLPEPKTKELIAPPTGQYNIIYADPPWQYWEDGKKNQSRHYLTMPIDDIKAIQPPAADNCILFMWATYPYLKEALEVIEAWGFKYSTAGFVWIKKNKVADTPFFGLGSWTRANSELCLIATKGSVERQSASVSQIIESPIEEHSKKPDIVRDKIVELVGDLPRIEMFARQATDGWDVWGQEANNG